MEPSGAARPSLLRRSWLLRLALRLAFLLVASEASLFVAARLYSRIMLGGSVDGAIVCVGDSNTFGMGAPRGRSYPDQLRELLLAGKIATPVMNLGFPGLTAGAAVARLEQALDDGTPACVLFLGGHNDWIRSDNVLAADEGLAVPQAEARGGLSRLRTVRMIETAWHVVNGNLARLEFGGAPQDRSRPEWINSSERMAEFERAAAGSAHDIFPWLVYFWGREQPAEAQRAFDEFESKPDFARCRTALMVPIESCRFELALLAGRQAPLPPASAETGIARQYSRFAPAYAALAQGRFEESRELFAPLAAEAAKSWRGLFMRTHAAWIDLLERNWSHAREQLDAVVDDLATIALPRPAERYVLAGSALARLFGDEGALAAESPARRERWQLLLAEEGHADGQAWLVAAEWVDALKRGDAAAVRAVAARARALVAATAASTPLHWLVDHPDADFARARAELELAPPRAAWIGVKGVFFRSMNADELARATAPAFDRLAELARLRGFPIALLTYLDYEKKVPSDRLRAFAAEQALPLIDLQIIHPVAELAVDDKARFFSADRSHPNEAGYGLMAHAVLPIVRDLLARSNR